jgi:hypothetical protein
MKALHCQGVFAGFGQLKGGGFLKNARKNNGEAV